LASRFAGRHASLASTRAGLDSLKGRYDAINIKLDKAGGLTEALALARAMRDLGQQPVGVGRQRLLDQGDAGRRAGGEVGLEVRRRKAAARPLLKVKLAGDGDPERIAAVRRGAPESRSPASFTFSSGRAAALRAAASISSGEPTLSV
jgi:L-alanine-DL-glutamate epimerase-like enolase superfamily enzyme